MLMILSIPGVLFVHPSSSSPPAASPPFVLRPSPSVLGCCLLCQFLSNFTHPPLSPPLPSPSSPFRFGCSLLTRMHLCLSLGCSLLTRMLPFLPVLGPPPSPSLPPSPLLPPSLPPSLPSSLPPFLPSSLPPFLPSSLPPFLPPSPLLLPTSLPASFLSSLVAIFPRFYRPSFCDRAVAMDPELRVTAQRAMRLGISLTERSLDYLLPATSPESPPRPRPTRPALPMSESGPPNSPPNGGPPAPRLRSPSPPTTRPSRRASVRTGSANQPTPRRSRSLRGVSPKSKASPLHGTTRRPTFPAPAASHALQPGMARPSLVPAPAPRFPLGQASRLRVGTASGTRNTVRFDCGTRNPVRSGPHTQPTRPLRIQRQTPPPRQRHGDLRQSAGSGSVAGGGAHAREPSRDSARVRTQVRAPPRWLRLWCCQLAFSSNDSPLVLRLPCCIPCIPSLPASLLPLRHSSLAWFLLQL